MFFLHKFSHSGPFTLDYVVFFDIPKKALSSPIFTIKILVVKIFGCYYADN